MKNLTNEELDVLDSELAWRSDRYWSGVSPYASGAALAASKSGAWASFGNEAEAVAAEMRKRSMGGYCAAVVAQLK